jgi:hypothetical protein
VADLLRQGGLLWFVTVAYFAPISRPFCSEKRKVIK